MQQLKIYIYLRNIYIYIYTHSVYMIQSLYRAHLMQNTVAGLTARNAALNLYYLWGHAGILSVGDY